MERTYTRRRHIHGGNIYTEGTYTQRGHTHKGDIYKEGYRGDINTEKTYI